MNRLYFAGASVVALFCATAAMAQDQAADPDAGGASAASAVAEVVSTATRSPQSVDRIGSSLTIIDAVQIQASQSVPVVDLIVQTPGVSFTRNGGPGSSTTVNIRGAEGHHTVVLIDGVKLNDPSSTQGGFNFGNLLLGDIERIEVLRGAQSTLWGSQAIGGVVNVITAAPKPGLQKDISVEVGERDTRYLRAGIGGANDRGSFRLAGGYYSTDGFSSFAGGTEADGYRNTGASGRLNVKLTETASLDLRAVYSDGTNEFDGFGRDSLEFAKTEELVAYSGLNFSLLYGRLKNRIGFAYTDTNRNNFNPVLAPDTLTFDAAGENRRLEYQGTFAIADGYTAVFGAETEHSRFTTRSPDPSFPSPATTGKGQIDSLYTQVQGEVLPGLTLTGGVRYDDHDVFGDQTLGQVAAAWALNDGATVLRASFGQGFRAPGLYELFSEYGNTALQPEDVDSWDASIAQRFWDGRVTVAATYFARKAENEINFFSCPTVNSDPFCTVNGAPRFGYYANVQATKASGFELSGAYHPTERFNLSANWTYTDAEFDSGANAGKQLVRRPKEMGNLTASYLWPIELTTAVSVRYSGEVFTNASNTTKLAPYTVVDFRASYPVNETIEVFGRLENAFDEDYQTVPNYGTPGRGAFVGLRARF